MSKPKVLFSVANDSKVLYPHLYGPNGSLDAKNYPESNDYLTDAIFQYMKSSDAFDVYECPWMVHMYKDSTCKKEDLTGFGFALRKDLTQTPCVLDLQKTLDMISDREFDYIVMDSRTVNPWWNSRGLSPFYDNTIKIINHVLKYYPANKILFFDGEDQPTVIRELVGKVTYFKRELTFQHPMVHPIGYCFPEWKFRESSLVQKTKDMATVIPGEKSTYIFREEEAYYSDYQSSKFAMTWKKLGWDCFRHHEILFSSCVPIFPDIDECPPLTLTHYPKDICLEIMQSGVVIPGYRKWQQYHDLYCFLGVSVDFSKMSNDHYSDILGRLKEHSLKYLTSRKMTDYILSRTETII